MTLGESFYFPLELEIWSPGEVQTVLYKDLSGGWRVRGGGPAPRPPHNTHMHPTLSAGFGTFLSSELSPEPSCECKF